MANAGVERGVGLRWWEARLCLLLTAAVGFALPVRAATWVFATPLAGDSVQVTLTATDAPGGNGVDLSVDIPAEDGTWQSYDY